MDKTKKDKGIVVYGLYDYEEAISAGIDRLKAENFRADDISVLFPDKRTTRDVVHKMASKAPEGATTGGALGAILGGLGGWLVGIGTLAIPGLGPFIAAGPLMAALSGAAVGGALGGIAGALIGMGIPEVEAKRYEAKVKEGGILIAVHADDRDWASRAKRILEATGARDISSTKEVNVPGAPERKHTDVEVPDRTPKR